MAVPISPLPLLLLFCLLAASASARPCKTLFFFSATTTTYYSHPRNPNSLNSLNSYFLPENPNSLTLILTTTTTTRFPDRRPTLSFNSNPTNDDSQSSTLMTSPNFPLNFVSSSIRDRTKDIMSVVGALLFGVGCGALTAATMYFVWSLFSPHSFDLDDEFSDDDESDDVTAFKKKLGYVAIPSIPKVVDHDDDLKNPAPAPPAKEMV